MCKIMKRLVIGGLLLIFMISFVYAAEDCYLKFDINESKVGEEINFELIGQNNLYGDYEGPAAIKGSDGDYTLKVLGSGGSLLRSYEIYTSRFIFYDNIGNDENPGGVEEFDYGMISIIVDYEEGISGVEIDNGGETTSLSIDSSSIACTRTCMIENETGTYGVDKCCEDFLSYRLDENSFVCGVCGDGLCLDYEDRYSCVEDCSVSRNYVCSLEFFEFGNLCLDRNNVFYHYFRGDLKLFDTLRLVKTRFLIE
jgi:hypothetical protein